MFEIEIAGPNNENHQFGPTKHILRGRWSAHHVAEFSKHDALNRIHKIAPVIPGMRVRVEKVKGGSYTCSIYDPLRDTDEGRALWEKLRPACEGTPFFPGKGKIELPESVTFPMCDHDTVKTWMYAMVRVVDAGYGIITKESNPLPTLEQVKAMPGRRRREHFAMRQLQPEDMYADAVPVGGAASAAG